MPTHAAMSEGRSRTRKCTSASVLESSLPVPDAASSHAFDGSQHRKRQAHEPPPEQRADVRRNVDLAPGRALERSRRQCEQRDAVHDEVVAGGLRRGPGARGPGLRRGGGGARADREEHDAHQSPLAGQ